MDPEEEQRLEEERRREEEARSRAARAAAKQQRTDYIASLGAYEGASSSPNDPDFDPEMDIPGLGRNRRRGTALNVMRSSLISIQSNSVQMLKFNLG